jgi:hypothetical protein
MARLENLFRILFAGIFAVCAVGAWSNRDLPTMVLFLALAAGFLWRTNR